MKIFFRLLMMCGIMALTSFDLKAQSKDYVVTTEGEKLACTITKPMFSSNGRYQTAQMMEPEEITLSNIKEYYVSKDRTLYRKVLKRPGKEGSGQYMVVLENGKINLYQEISSTMYTSTAPNGIMHSTSSSTATWYISKGSDTLTTIKDSEFSIFLKSKKSRENAFGEMIKDNKEVYDKYVSDEKFSFAQIRDLIHLYNTGKPFGSDAGRDYVIRKKKDTIFCEIELGSFDTFSRYRPTPNDKFIKIDTSITEYFLSKDSSTFLLKTLPGEKQPKYVKCLVTGGINLYAYSLNNAAADDEASLYASKKNGELVLLKDKYHKPGKNEKNAFANLISDDPALAGKFASLAYNFSSILDCVKTYDSDSK